MYQQPKAFIFFYHFVASKQVGAVVNELMTSMKKMPVARFREITEKYGFNYGPTFSIIKEIWECDNEGLCLVDISESLAIQRETGSYVIHPSILDACLQSCFIPLGSSSADDKSIVPVGFKSITLNDMPSTTHLYCHVNANVAEFGRFDVTLMSPSGKVLLTMSDFRVAELTSSPRQLPFDELAYEVQWKEDELQGQGEPVPQFTCIVLKDSTDFSVRLLTKLQTFGVKVVIVNPPIAGCFDTEVEEVIRGVFSDIPSSNSSNLRVINLWPLEVSLFQENYEIIEQVQRLVFSSSVFLLKLMIEKELLDSRLFFITECTQLLDACDRAPEMISIPWGSTLWGLRRTANLEEFNLRVTTVDLCNKEDQHDVDSLVHEVLGASIEDEVAFRNGKRFTNRLLRSKLQQEKSRKTASKENKLRRSLYLSTIPSSKTLCLRQQSFARPSHNEVTVDVHFCWTPSESVVDLSKPNGCVFVSGKVTALPETKEHTLQIGDEVCGIIPSGRVARSISIDISNVFVKPISLAKEKATYFPACLALASHALQRAASDAQNQRLLVHQADRGPGPAAVVLAKASGHRVFCTISDTCKTCTKSVLLNLGAESVMRQNFFALSNDSSDQFDAVLFFFPPSPNALQKSSRGLKKGGRVIILSSEFAGDVVFPANKNIKYEREDISDILQSPLAFEKLSLQSLEVLESKGVLKQLLGMQVECADVVASIKAANRSFKQQSFEQQEAKESSDISYVIQSLATLHDEHHLDDVLVLPPGLDECGLKGNRTYLVAGGLGGFGFEVACWMAENGAGTIGLLGRSKPSDAKSQELRQIEMRTGAKILTFQVCKLSTSYQVL